MSENINKLVSIVIPCYNHELYIEDCIKSVIEQTYENIELIIIDDGSKDRSVDRIEQLVEKCRERFVRFEFRSRSNRGLSATLNEALEWCEGEYFSCIASDDMLLPNKTFVQVRFLEEHKDIVAAFSGVILIDEQNKELGSYKGSDKAYNFKDIITHNYILPAPTQMLRLKLIETIGGYKPNLIIEDWYIWLKISQYGEIYSLPQILCKYRRHSKNTSNNVDKMYKGRVEVLEYFKDSEYYEMSLKEIEWLKSYESFICNRNILSYTTLLKKNFLRTILLTINNIKKKLK